MTDKTKFRPVTGTEAQIEMAPKTPGWVYFAEDTGKIYYDKDTETRVTMGGSGVAIHYGKAPAGLTQDPDFMGGQFFKLTRDDLQDSEAVVSVDDLIFNSDGTFYRVYLIMNSNTIYCTKAAVAGGGGGSVVGPSVGSVARLTLHTPETVSLINGQDISIEFTPYSQIEVDGTVLDEKLTMSWSLAEKVGENYVTYHNGTSFLADHGVRTSLSFGEFLREDATTRITIKGSGANSGDTPSRQQDFTTSELSLTENSDFSTMAVYNTDNLIVWCNVSGNMNKILDYYFDDELVHTERLGPTSEPAQKFQIPAKLCTHGYHTVKIELFQAIGTSLATAERALSVPALEFETAVKNAGETKPIIWLGEYQKTYYNYDDIKVPYLVFDPESSETTTVYLWKNGLPTASPERQVPASSYKKWNEFEIIDADLDVVNYYSVSCGTGDREVRRDITFTVVKDPVRKMEIVKQDYLQLLFDAKGRSNAESSANRSNWSYKRNNGSEVKAEFIDFNWYNNGWVTDDIGNSCLRISNGAQFKLPIGTTVFASGTTSQQSHTYEFQFKVRNVQDYSELIKNITRYINDDNFWTAFNAQTKYDNYDAFLQYYLPIYELKENETEEDRVKYDDLEFASVYKKISLDKIVGSYFSGNESGATGFCLGSQDAFFSNGDNTVSVSYVEDKMVYLSMVYDHQPLGISRIYIYINGVLTGAIKSSKTSQFLINNTELVFNSEYCDFDLYKIRIYNTALSVNDIVMNHAVDKKDVNTYDLNGLAIANATIGEHQLNFQKMIDYNNANPSKYIMPYIIFDTSKSNNSDRLPWSKDVEIPCSVTFKNTGLDRAYATGELLELAIEDGLCTAESDAKEQEAAVREYYLHHCPSFTGENWEITVQGTSSQFYPRRNYKIKSKTEFDSDGAERTHIWLNDGPFATDYIVHGMTRNVEEDEDDPSVIPYTNPCHSDWFYMDNYDVGTNRFTMKIDYMESSGSYNGGFANLVANAYTKHPLDDYIAAGMILDPNGKLSTDELRTSVQGYPVLAFHKKSDGSYTYIGRYNMLLDKGSDECYGFKPDKKVLAKMFTEEDDEGKIVNRRLRDVAECWEYSNNARGYCSFRDPWVRRELSFRPPTGTPGVPGNGMTPKGAPLVADSYEYRYHEQEDYLDVIYNLTGATVDDFAEMGVTDAAGAAEKMYEWYANWERACQWVWSTCIDDTVCDALKVPHQGNYIETVVGKQAWEKGKFYIITEGTDEEGNPISDYVIDNSDAWDPAITYFEIVDLKNESGTVIGETYANAYASDYVYESGVYYTIVNGSHIVDRGEALNESAIYYRLEEYSDEELAAMAAAGNVTALPESVTYGNKTYKYDTVEYRVDKFVYELKDHFDIDYLATYFVMTEVFECYDSRGKNCMMASWGPLKEGGDYIWYPIFYDIDTQLGINNTGIPSFEYSVDATEAGNFSTSDSVLWNNFYKNFRNSYILQKYRQLKGYTTGTGNFGKLTTPILDSVDRIERWYQADPEETGMIAMRGQRPLVAINLDEYYKYLTIYNGAGVITDPSTNWKSSTGRINDQGQFVQETTDYLYALQGDRSLSRIQFLTNRIEYIDSWLNVGNYARGGYNRLWGRVQANNGNISDYWLDTESDPYYDEQGTKRHEFDAEYWMTLTPIHDSYITLSDDNEAYPSQKFTGSPVKFEIAALENGFRRSQGYPEQLLYVYGLNQMRDIGDLSKLYWTEFKIEGDAKKLTRLKLGHDGYMTNANGEYVNRDGVVIDESQLSTQGVTWFNNKMNPPSFPSSKEQSGMPLLKEVNVCNITVNGSVGTPALDLTSCEKLENFRATGSNFEEIKFAEGVALNTIYLPASVKSLGLTEAKLLNNIIETYSYPTKDESGNLVANPGLYIEGLTDATTAQLESTETIPLHTINIVGDALGYDSYKLLTKFFKRRYSKTVDPNTGAAATTQVTLTGVKWSPYELLVEGDNYVAADRDLYFVDNNHYGLRPITDEEIDVFGKMVLNGEIYKKNTSIPEETINLITDVDMLTKMASTEAGTQGSLFLSAASAPIPNISGIIYVNNTTKISEKDIRALSEAYPNLTLFFNDVDPIYSAKFVLPDLDDKTGAYLGTYSYVPFADGRDGLSTQKIEEGWFENPYSLYLPKKPNYDFYGWSTTTDLTGLIKEENWSTQTLGESKDYTFYAIFTIHSYHIEYFVGTKRIHEEYIPYGDMLKDPGLVPSYTDDSLADEEKYRFLGYSQNENQLVVNSETAAKTVKLDTLMSVQDYKFYATFIKESVFASPLDDSYFIFTPEDHSDISGGYYIYPAEGVKFSGKITLPSTYNGQPIVGIGGFYTQTDVTHIYWHGDPQLQIILANCFGNDSTELTAKSLEVFQCPPSLKIIGNRAFSNCLKLKPMDLTQTSLEQIGGYAFFGAMAMSSKYPKFRIPGSVKKIGDFGFGNTKLPLGTLAIGGPGDPTQIPDVGGLGTKAIWTNSFAPIDKIEIYGATDEIVQGWINDGCLTGVTNYVKEVQRIDA